MSISVEALTHLGQSLWYDNIERRLLENGELAAMIERGDIRGITSNPSIFHNAIAGDVGYRAYAQALKSMSWSGYNSQDIFDQLSIEDIRAAADLFGDLYEESHGGDGFASLEVSPTLAHDSEGTLAEAVRLWQAVDRPNLMVKIPATSQGIPAIRQAVAAGININVTLIFSLTRYGEVMGAYLSGLEDRLDLGLPLNSIASVASFFVSRIDSKVDKYLQGLVHQEGPQAKIAASLLGKMAIASARLAYQAFRKVFEGERFLRLQAKGANLQRPLWASTSTKNPAYPDTQYVDQLIGAHTVNTVPPQTLDAFKDHGLVGLTIEQGIQEAHQAFSSLADIGISIEQVTRELESEGVAAFTNAYRTLIQTIETRRLDAIVELGPLSSPVARQVARLDRLEVLRRMHAVDPALWTSDPAGQSEVRKRMGWLSLPESSRAMLPEWETFAAQVRSEGITHALLLGMGGSSMAPEVFSSVFGDQPGTASKGLRLAVLDSTDPDQVFAAGNRAPVENTLYIVASKSGGTAEVRAFLDYFWARAERRLGKRSGDHFIAITDPGTSLEKEAQVRGFRRVFHADPEVGGRNSALTAFGLVPAALVGVDNDLLLERAAWMADQCAPQIPSGRSPGLVLGAVMGEAARQGRDKLTLIVDPKISAFGAWLEQLVAESSGKQNKGIVPVDGEPLAAPANYGNDRLFVYLRLDGRYDQAVKRLRSAGLPVLQLDIGTPYDLGSEFYRWEIATAVACSILGVNSFDQPDVQDSKTRTVNKIQSYQRHGHLDEGQPSWTDGSIQVYGEIPEGAGSLSEVLSEFLGKAAKGDYIALNAYLPRNSKNEKLLRKLRIAVQGRSGLATTVGFGPRFLHSTGQLHKGGKNNGLFLQITARPARDMQIPSEGFTFQVLERAQALGDLEALQSRQRRVLRIHLDREADLESLVEAVQKG